MDLIFGIVGVIIVVGVHLLGVAFVGMGLYLILSAKKRTQKQNQALLDEGKPEMTDAERKGAAKSFRLVGLACIIVGAVVFVGAVIIFIFPDI